MAETRILPETFRQCYGWAYEPCDRMALWVAIITFPNGSWEAHPLCVRHAAEVMGDASTWTTPPEARTLIEARIARRIWTDLSDLS